MQILINVPSLSRKGGVASLFNILELDRVGSNLSLFVIHNNLTPFLRIPIKYIQFAFKLIGTDIVHLNPSLSRKSFLRDAVFAWLTLITSRKLVVYWHGWDNEYESKIKGSKLLKFIFSHSFLQAHVAIVLGSVFEDKLRNLGYKNRVFIETNTAENKYIGKNLPKTVQSTSEIKILFLSRLEVKKGLYVAIETLQFLNQTARKYKLIIAGSGSEEDNVKKIAQENTDYEWVGFVEEESKHNILSSAHILFLPSYSEGLPLSILEGMLYGLPIISRPIGGIPDLIKNEENGFLVDSLYPKDFAEKIRKIAEDQELFLRISTNNINKSKIFSPDNVRKRLMAIYEFALKTEN